MKTYHNITGLLQAHPSWLAFLLCCGILVYLPPTIAAQQPAATINSLQGTVTVSIQGEAATPAAVGLALRTGDTLTTGPGANVALTLSEGSTLNFGENTTVDITALSQRPGTKVRTSRLRLLAGKIRAFLSPGHQEKGSSFTVDTPNAIAGVKFSRPEIMVSYDPATETTIIEAYTVDMVVRNLLTQEVKDVPKGYRGIVRRERITIVPLVQREGADSGETIEESPETPIEDISFRSNSLLSTRNAVRQAACATAPTSIGPIGTGEIVGTGSAESIDGADDSKGSAAPEGGGAETSANPSPGVRPSRPDRQSRAIQVHIEN